MKNGDIQGIFWMLGLTTIIILFFSSFVSSYSDFPPASPCIKVVDIGVGEECVEGSSKNLYSFTPNRNMSVSSIGLSGFEGGIMISDTYNLILNETLSGYCDKSVDFEVIAGENYLILIYADTCSPRHTQKELMLEEGKLILRDSVCANEPCGIGFSLNSGECEIFCDEKDNSDAKDIWNFVSKIDFFWYQFILAIFFVALLSYSWGRYHGSKKSFDTLVDFMGGQKTETSPKRGEKRQKDEQK